MLAKQDLHDYQERSIDQLYNNDNLYLVAPVGAGKTIIALTAIAELLDDGVIRQALVLAPKNVAQNVWAQEASQWAHTADLRVSVCLGTPNQRLDALCPLQGVDICVATYDNIQWLVQQPEFSHFDLICYDEASRLKNPKGKRSKELRKRLSQFKVVWGMSGTPAPNGVPDLYNQVLMIDKGALWGPSYWKWQKHYFWQDQRTYKLTPKAGSRTITSLLDDFSTLSAKVDVSEIPRQASETRVVAGFSLSPEERRQYSKMKKDFYIATDKGAVAADTAAIQINKLRQVTSGFIYDTEQETSISIGTSRLDAAEELVSDIGENVIIAYQFRVELAELQKLYPRAPFIGAGAKNVPGTILGWNKGHTPVLLMHPASAGHGLNLQHGGRQLIFYGLPWSLEHYEQSIGRISRQGQKSQVVVHHLIDVNTVDSRVYAALQAKQNVQEAVIDAVEEA